MNRLKKNKSATVVIGSGFGDEGKGLMTDQAAAPFGADCMVARFNGGAQAGHTVVLPDGTRHVHSHLGSGTLAGAATFLSRHFVSNPLLYHREIAELKAKRIVNPVVFADERGLVTTPYDMLLNQFAEQARGRRKHGSCGIGFGETVERCLAPRFATLIADLSNPKKLRTVLDDIRNDWVPERLHKLGINALSAEQREILDAEDLRENFIEAAVRFFEEIRLSPPGILRAASHTVLEGAQGLLLDQDGGWFPHVTRSNTGLRNAVQLAEEAGIERLEVIYMTRAYATRHGAGPLPHELPAAPYAGIRDATNVENPFQDALRFGWLDLDLLGKSIENDFGRFAINPRMNFSRLLTVTCLDQLDRNVTFVSGGKICESNVDDFLMQASSAARAEGLYLGSGPTRETIFCKFKGRKSVGVSGRAGLIQPTDRPAFAPPA